MTQTKIVLVMDVPEPPKTVIRWDLAWQLFLPDALGDIPAGDGKQSVPLARWFWEAMGHMMGRLRPDSPETVFCVVPPLTPAAEDFVIRLASFWSDIIIDHRQGPSEHNCWRAPIVNVFGEDTRSEAEAQLTTTYGPNETAHYFMPLLGVGRAFMRVEVVPPGSATARLHSHSAVDEYYLVLSGRAVLRMGSHELEVGPGTLIGKPTGPDLTSHLVASLGESIMVLDMEIWPDRELRSKDIIYYPDQRELLWRGEGWRGAQVISSMGSAWDLKQHYDDGYVRQDDGHWVPANIPGTDPRKPD
ncbi:cupin domain-containing protein [Sulfobacillus thermosulfidooxidans]|uniref:cupin domain-containing protein n=1 Tax=Sulfobacillus thermosulfidooxidans TaxID=28034 RepID=UPI000407889A|nr:cupin domain-containing protein [Sulfobacillus thermosulfidooxidans]